MSLLQMSISGGILIVLVLLFRMFALHALPKRAFVLLWEIVLFRLLVPYTPLFPVPLPLSWGREEITLAGSASRGETIAAERGEQSASAEDARSGRGEVEGITQKIQPPKAKEFPPLEAVLRAVWMCGAAMTGAVFVAAYALSYLRFRKALPVEHEPMRRWAARHPLRRGCRVRSFGTQESPMTYGILRPVILAPGAPVWWEGEEAKFALEHEYIHMRRFHPALKMLLATAVSLHWFNPLVWGMYVTANRDIELSCDEAVLRQFGEESRGKYARILLSTQQRSRETPLLYPGFGTNTTSERIVEIMNYKKRSLLSCALAVMMVASLAACAAAGTSGGQQGFQISGESMELNGLALGGDGEAASIYTNGELRLLIPLEYQDLLLTQTPENDENGILFTVSELASIEAARAQGEEFEGAGWLFSIGMISEIQLYDMLCGDMSGMEVFARGADGIYYVYYHPTDVRMMREADAPQDSLEQWTALNAWAERQVRDSFIAANDGLTAETYGNADLDVYLARAAFTDDTAYAIIYSEYRPMTPNGVYGEPYAMRLIRNAQVEMLESTDAPEGEYFILNFPNDDMRFDFFLAPGSENIYRQVWSSHEQLFRINFADGTTKASQVVQEWYDAMARADFMRELGYTPDDLIGRWAEKFSGRGAVTITQGARGTYDVLVEWANGAAERSIWEMTAKPAGGGGVLRYENGRHLIRSYESEEQYTETVQYENGTGEFYLNSAYELMWTDDVDNAGENTVFINAG